MAVWKYFVSDLRSQYRMNKKGNKFTIAFCYMSWLTKNNSKLSLDTSETNMADAKKRLILIGFQSWHACISLYLWLHAFKTLLPPFTFLLEENSIWKFSCPYELVKNKQWIWCGEKTLRIILWCDWAKHKKEYSVLAH